MWKGHYEIENKASETGVLRHGNKPTTSVCSGQPALHSGELWSVEKEWRRTRGFSKAWGSISLGNPAARTFPPFSLLLKTVITPKPPPWSQPSETQTYLFRFYPKFTSRQLHNSRPSLCWQFRLLIPPLYPKKANRKAMAEKQDIVSEEAENAQGFDKIQALDGIIMPEELASLSDEDREKLGKKATFKMDIVIMPVLVIMYILNYLDRQNIASAKLANIEQDLNMSPVQYQTAVSILFCSYSMDLLIIL